MTDQITETLYDGWGQTMRIDNLIVDEQSDFQHIQIFDNAVHGRVLVLDGIVQLTERDEATYSEMLSHLPILELGTVQRVMIVGGGDGAIAEEVLKHPGIAKVDLVDIDGRVIELCKQHFPNVHKGAFDDPRLAVHAVDAFGFLEDDAAEGRYDLIIADRPDPVGPAKVLFQTRFYELVKRALTKTGVAVFQTGVPALQGDELADTAKQHRSVFNQSGVYTVATPTYVGGLMALTWGSKGAVLGSAQQVGFAHTRFNNLTLDCHYYNPSMHMAAFALPQFMADLVTPGS